MNASTKTAPSRSRLGLAFKLSIFLLTATTTIFLLAFVYNYYESREVVFSLEQEKVRHVSEATVNRIESVLNGVENPPRFLASLLEKQDWNEARLKVLIREMVHTQEVIFGSTVAFEPYAFEEDRREYAPYFYEAGEEIEFTQLTGDYNYFMWDWYLLPKLLERPVWSEPYYDEGGGEIIMSTYSAPFYEQPSGALQGIVTADISLEWLVTLVESVRYFESGYAFLISQNGVFVTHPNPDYIMRESVFSIAEGTGDPQLRTIGKRMIAGEEDFVRYDSPHLRETVWMYFAPLPSSGWSLGIVLPEDELFADLYALNQQVFLIGVVGILMMIGVVVAIAVRVTQPLRALVSTTSEIAKGNLDKSIPAYQSGDEIGELSSSFENMRVALKEYINNLRETTAAKERIESELKIARSIQMNFLPKKFPPFPDRQEFDLFARLQPAKEVGGDLYDFFLVDDRTLFISVGDVADKGVPAALFMAVTKTLMKGITEQERSPATILARVNDELAQENEDAMFVTLFCGLLDLQSGDFVYSNAGHNPPVLVRSGQPPEWLTLPPGFLLGPVAGMQYQDARIHLHPGDAILAYTDGVNESMDPDKEMFGNERLLGTVAQTRDPSAEAYVQGLFAAVQAHAQDEPQSDDITVLGLRYTGSSGS